MSTPPPVAAAVFESKSAAVVAISENLRLGKWARRVWPPGDLVDLIEIRKFRTGS